MRTMEYFKMCSAKRHGRPQTYFNIKWNKQHHWIRDHDFKDSLSNVQSLFNIFVEAGSQDAICIIRFFSTIMLKPKRQFTYHWIWKELCTTNRTVWTGLNALKLQYWQFKYLAYKTCHRFDIFRKLSSGLVLHGSWKQNQSQKTQGSCVADFATLSDERMSCSKIFPLFNTDKRIRRSKI